MDNNITTADYDLVGQYTQDDINGFDENQISKMISHANIQSGNRILDAMGGDGNLTLRICQYCEANNIDVPEITLLEFSRVQCEFAKVKLKDYPVKVIHGDIISLKDLTTGEKVATNHYDRIFIKSANHELPIKQQNIMYKNVESLLRDSGIFINLGFAHDNEVEQAEFKKIARAKDSLAGLYTMAKNRHFPTKEEVHKGLTGAGFATVKTAEPITYTIKSNIVAEHYFKSEKKDLHDMVFQASQVKARNLRKTGKILFNGDISIMRLPGEITVARKSTLPGSKNKIYQEYPYTFLKNIKVHRELLEKISSHIANGSNVLDLGCGPGLFLHHIINKNIRYTGVDLSQEFILNCQNDFLGAKGTAFICKDINEFHIDHETYNSVALINVLYQSGVKAKKVLTSAIDGLKTNGLVFVSGPTSSESFVKISEQIKEQLIEDDLYEENQDVFEAIKEANSKLLKQDGNYWSAEGMAELLVQLGCSGIEVVDTSIFYGQAYLVVGRK